MIQRIFIALGLFTFLMTACQNEPDVDINPNVRSEAVSVKVAVSMKDISVSTGYEPITRNSTSDNITISPLFNYIILQDFGTDQPYIIERVGTGNITAPKGRTYGSIAIDGVNDFEALSIEIRPGKYKLIIFTGARSVKWNSTFKEGQSIPRENSTESFPMACSYMNIDFWTFAGEKGLQEEVFYGVKEFEVTKTEDLHSSPNEINVGVGLERRVSKFRVLLKDIPSEDGENMFAEGSPIAILIKADVIPTNGNPLPAGLNIWGNVWYDEAEPLMRYKYVTMTQSTPFQGPDIDSYYVSAVGATSYAPYFFTDPYTQVPITVSNFDCTSRDYNPRYVYFGEHDFVLKNNHITGLVLKPTNDIIDEKREVLIEPDYDAQNNLVNAADLYDANFEHNY